MKPIFTIQKHKFLRIFHPIALLKFKRACLSYFRSLLFILTRPIARILLYTGSLKPLSIKNEKLRHENKTKLIDKGGMPLSLLTEDERTIDAMFFDVKLIHPELPSIKGSNPTVIYCLGNSMVFENIYTMIEFYLQHSVNVMVFNYGGYGDSEGTPTALSTYRDIETVYRYIFYDQAIPNNKIIVHGFSMGGGPASFLAAKYPVDLVLDRTYGRVGDVIGGLLGLITNYLYPYDNIARIKDIKGNIHIIEAANDEVMAKEHVEQIFEEIIFTRHQEAHGQEIKTLHQQYITIIPGGGHTDCWLTDLLGIYDEEQKKFFQRVIHPIRGTPPKSENFLKKGWNWLFKRG